MSGSRGVSGDLTVLGRRVWPLGIVGILGGILVAVQLGDRDLWSSHEARAAQNAQRILDEGDCLTPRAFDDHVELQKPPLFYWLVALIGKATGQPIDAWAVRLPAAFAGWGTAMLVCGFLTHRGRPWAGFLASFALFFAHHFTWLARTGRIDLPLTFCVTLAVLALWSDANSSRWKTMIRIMVASLALAAGILLKGALGLLLPALAIVMATTDWHWPWRPFSALRDVPWRRLALALVLGLVLALPWFVIAHQRTHGEFTRVFFWYHHFQRAAGTADTLATHPWWYYVPRFAVDALPVILLAPFAYWYGRDPVIRDDAEARGGWFWFLGIFLFLSLARFKRADYLLPAYPGFAVWLGCRLERIFAFGSLRPRRVLGALGALVLTSGIAAGAVFHARILPEMNQTLEKRTLAAEIRGRVPQPHLILLFRVEDHLLTYHLGRPVNSFLEWENLDVWVSRPGPYFVVMPADCARDWKAYINAGELIELLRFQDRSERRTPRDLVLMRTQPRGQRTHETMTDDRPRQPAQNQPRTD